MTSVTYGSGPLGRIYERLRKRSYRHYRRVLSGFDPDSMLTAYGHVRYLDGVRDALRAVEEEVM